MKRLFPAILGLFLSCSSARAGSLQEAFSHRVAPVTVAVADPANHSDDSALSPADFKKALEQALSARRTPKFSVVPDKSAAELEVSAEIVESIFTEHDPLDQLMGTEAAVWDAMHDDHYARLTAVYAVRDVKTGRTLWTDKLKATVTDHTMTRDESRVKVIARAAQIFIREAFGKKSGSR